ncbi:DoxX family protein [uncultured Flavobacterium sp.]|uniref:DoxX family protein n=1 Tax=uncultured Flavobacterium sp. TaxID=165435 RepID=UPI0025D5ED3A|nr:DoxX family protein [uncultured Flavobacterium sp.]
MSKTDKIIYWVATIWLALGMLSTGIVQLLQVEEEAVMIQRLGYPGYIMPLLGVWKILGVIIILMPKTAVVKEWAYAGFFFAMSGAIVSHIAIGDGVLELLGPILLIILTVVSWHFRPEERKVNA